MISRNMVEFELRGGLGDAFITLHETEAYEALDELGIDDRATIIINSHNPFVSDIFKWHPAAKKIDLIVAKRFFPDYFDKAERAKAGLPPTSPAPYSRRERAPITFYPSPEDRRTIEEALPKGPFLVAALSASGVDRNLPSAMIESAFAVARRMGVPVVLLGRTYDCPFHEKDELRPSGSGVVDLIDRLSVPGTVEVVKRAKAVLSCHSCLLLASWYERKPVFTAYPRFYAESDFWRPSPFSFGKDYPETVHMLFEEYRPHMFETFMAENFGKPTA